MATCVVSLMTLQQAASRFGASYAPRGRPGAQYSAPPSPEGNFIQPAGLMAPGQMFAVLANRHMHRYGTSREHFAEIAISTRENARRRETALMREPLDREQYFAARMIAEPLCLYDFCLECDGAVAVVTVPTERAKDLRQPPVSIHRVGARWARPVGPGHHLDEHARRGVRVVGAPSRGASPLRDGGPRSVRRRRRAAL